jgi:hypothetical protein
MDLDTKVNGKIIKDMEKGYIMIALVVNMKVNVEMMQLRATVCVIGRMAKNMLDNLKITRDIVMA